MCFFHVNSIHKYRWSDRNPWSQYRMETNIWLLDEFIFALLSHLFILPILLQKYWWHQENYYHRSSQVIDSLHICTRWVSHRPDKQYPDHHRLDTLFAKEINLWLGSMHVNFDLFEVCVFVTWHITNLSSKLVHGVLWSCVTEVVLD